MRKVNDIGNGHVLVENEVIIKTYIEMSINEFLEKYYNNTFFNFKDEFSSQDLYAVSSSYKISRTMETVYLIYYNKKNKKLILKFLWNNRKLESSITPEVIGIFRTYYDKVDNKFRPKSSISSIRKNEYFNQKMLFDFFKNKILNRLKYLFDFVKSVDNNECSDKTESIERLKYFEKDIIKSFNRFNSYNYWKKFYR